MYKVFLQKLPGTENLLATTMPLSMCLHSTFETKVFIMLIQKAATLIIDANIHFVKNRYVIIFGCKVDR